MAIVAVEKNNSRRFVSDPGNILHTLLPRNSRIHAPESYFALSSIGNK